MSFYLNLGVWSSVFAVPQVLIDKYIKVCNESQLKLILFLLRYPEENINEEFIYNKTGIPIKEISSAIDFWLSEGLVSRAGSEIVPSASVVEVSKEIKNETTPKMLRADSLHIAKRLKESQNLAYLFSDAEAILGKTLSPSFCSVLLISHDDYNLPVEVILMLISHCVTVGRTSTTFIENTSKKWHELGVSTIQQAETMISEMNERDEAWKRLSSMLSIGARQPTKKELELAYEALVMLKFSAEMIGIAYEKTVDGTGKFQPTYMLKILKNWHKNSIITPQDLEEFEKKAKPTKSKEEKTSYNLDDFDKLNVFDIEDL